MEIEYWHINGETFGRPEVRRLVEKFNRENPDVRVSERFQQGSYTGLLENLQTAQAAGTPPDVATVGYDSLACVATNFRFVLAEDLAKEAGDEDSFDAWPENLLRLGQAGGQQAGVPYPLSVLVAYYNADMLGKAGLDPDDPPATWEGWARSAGTVKNKLGKPGLCMAVAPGITGYAQAMIESDGGEMLACDGGEARAAFDRPEAVEATRFWADLVADGRALNVLGDQTAQAFLGEEVPVLFGVTSSLAAFREQAGFDLKGTTFPAFEGRERCLPGGGNNLLVFSEDPARKEAAWRFVRFLTSAENMRAWCEATGYSPTRDDVAVSSEDPIQKIAAGQTASVVPWVSFPGPNAFQASQVFFDAHQEAISGRGEVAETLVRAASEVDGLIEGQPCA